jgi:fatty acyl-CoA reductase
MLTENLDLIINSAASINFDDPLQEAIKINYFGAQRILELAKECKNLEVLTHISTAYVNCNRSGFIEEKIYNEYEDADQIV